jgi:hypothetical protein
MDIFFVGTSLARLYSTLWAKYLLTTTLTLGLLSATNTVIANQNSTIDNYNTRYTPQGRIKAGKRGTYKKDIHVWVYTSAFAKRFGMPSCCT